MLTIQLSKVNTQFQVSMASQNAWETALLVTNDWDSTLNVDRYWINTSCVSTDKIWYWSSSCFKTLNRPSPLNVGIVSKFNCSKMMRNQNQELNKRRFIVSLTFSNWMQSLNLTVNREIVVGTNLYFMRLQGKTGEGQCSVQQCKLMSHILMGSTKQQLF